MEKGFQHLLSTISWDQSQITLSYLVSIVLRWKLCNLTPPPSPPTDGWDLHVGSLELLSLQQHGLRNRKAGFVYGGGFLFCSDLIVILAL